MCLPSQCRYVCPGRQAIYLPWTRVIYVVETKEWSLIVVRAAASMTHCLPQAQYIMQLFMRKKIICVSVRVDYTLLQMRRPALTHHSAGKSSPSWSSSTPSSSSSALLLAAMLIMSFNLLAVISVNTIPVIDRWKAHRRTNGWATLATLAISFLKSGARTRWSVNLQRMCQRRVDEAARLEEYSLVHNCERAAFQ